MSLWRSIAGVAPAAVVAVAAPAAAQVTTSSLAGRIATSAGATAVAGAQVTAVHTPSGTTYRATTRSDGRYTIPGMRVGGPYVVSVRALGYAPAGQTGVTLELGTQTDLSFALNTSAITLQTVQVTETTGPLSSSRTGAATRITAEAIQALPTISRNLSDFTRLTPQASGGSFGGQDTRMNNISIDGAFFNNAFGLGTGQPGGRTNVAPIPIEAIEQIQVNIAPFDVRQGNFVGAGVNAVTKSGTNNVEGAFYYNKQNQTYVGKKAGVNAFNPGTFDFGLIGGRLSGPVIKNKLFLFVDAERDSRQEPGTTFLANTGTQPVTGNTTRVLESDLQKVSTFLAQNFKYETGPYTGYQNETPSTRVLARADYNASDNHKFSLRYTLLNSSADQLVSNSTSLGFGNRRTNSTAMSFANSGYSILENSRSVVGEWNGQLRGGRMSTNALVGYTTNDESRGYKGDFFPTVDILKDGTTYMNFGFEPFTPANQLRYKTLQAQDNVSLYFDKHDVTVGVAFEKYNSDNVFYQGANSVYVYNSLDDFFADANGYLANPNRTTSPVTLRQFQVGWVNIPGLSEPLQQLQVYSYGAYAQDQWRPTHGLQLTLGVRADLPTFSKTGFANAQANALTFRDASGNSVHYATEKLPDAHVLWSPRFGFNWDVRGDRSTQIRGGTGVFSGRPPYVWISNQIGNNGIILGAESLTNTTARPFNPDAAAYKPKTVTGAPASSYTLNFTDPNFRFPQTWRTDFAVDQKLPWGMVGTAELLYGKDVNGPAYVNSNLPAPQATYTGADQRPRWTNRRINANVTDAFTITNEARGYNYSASVSLEKAFQSGFFAKGAYTFSASKNTVDPGSIAAGSWQSNAMPLDPNDPPLGYSQFSPGHRAFLALSYKREYFKVGATGISLFLDASTGGASSNGNVIITTNASYVFSGDANGDGGSSNDLVYIPRNQSEMNFVQFTTGSGATAKTFTVQQQKDAYEAYIAQDEYLSKHRGSYAMRGAVFLPMVTRADLSVTQDVFRSAFGKRNNVQIRLDVLNVGNLIDKSWGVGQRFVATSGQLLTNPAVDANGALSYRLRVINNELLKPQTFEKAAGLTDVYRMQLGVRYSFR